MIVFIFYKHRERFSEDIADFEEFIGSFVVVVVFKVCFQKGFDEDLPVTEYMSDKGIRSLIEGRYGERFDDVR
jgi:hypothetical protein